MEYRHLGKSGLRVSELSFGSWVTFGSHLDLAGARECMHKAFEEGVNFFDTAEVYAEGAAELLMGEVLKSFRRNDLVISTKIFWGGRGPNATGLSWKHLIEGTKNSLKRMQLDYVDMLFCHRPDPATPVEETVRAMDVLIKNGLVFYWGTSEWSAEAIEKAYQIAREINATPPTMEQPQYNMFHRYKIEEEFLPLYEKHGLGTTVWSPLDSGVLTGKYNKGIPENSRLASNPGLRSVLTNEKVEKVHSLSFIAQELGCTMAQLAIAWCLKNPHVSTVILGATSPAQLHENIQACVLKEKLTKNVMQTIEDILKGKIVTV